MNAIPRLRAVRGATTVDADTSAEIRGRTGELLAAILERNDLRQADIVSVLFTATPDLSADFPAVAAREMGLSATPLLCCQEIPVRDAIARCIRVLMHCYVPEGMQVRHVYLRDARQLRLDLPE
ncbi:MAG: chorismate mutase [Actinobacteria bacterium]|mgnify:CR=1 FL=1|jgi:chorismate mutase|nr:chorismate mutase [Actinomycetota bacterium]